jgi:NAD(P)-dependent dehydrogenase (short-subunit alcohol dehydrogenase family)
MSIAQHPRAIVTGAASGLGRALCLALARRGAKIVVADIDMTGAEETAQLVIRAGAEAETRHCDVSKADQVEALASFAQQRFGGTDLLVNNAGVAVSGTTGEVPLSDWEWVFGINLWGVIYGCHSFAPRFKAQRAGHILNVASAAGLLNMPDLGPYNVTKAGVISLSETLFGELRPFGVGVTVLCPSFFQTNIVQGGRAINQGGEQFVSLAQKHMRASKVQAPDVAQRALESCDRDQLYCVPMPEGQWGWRAKRWAPESFFRHILPNALKASRG